MPRLTPTQRTALDIAAQHPQVSGGNATRGGPHPTIHVLVADRLALAGFLEVTSWTGSVHTYQITDLGEAAR